MSRAPTTAAQRAKRLHLLDVAEIAALYDRPQFTDEERAYYFTLTPSEVAHMQTFTDGAVQAVFVLQLGYFKAKQRFFSLELAAVRADLIFILGHARLAVAPDDLRTLNPRTIQQQRQLILEHVRYRHAHAAERAQAYQVVLQAAASAPNPSTCCASCSSTVPPSTSSYRAIPPFKKPLSARPSLPKKSGSSPSFSCT